MSAENIQLTEKRGGQPEPLEMGRRTGGRRLIRADPGFAAFRGVGQCFGDRSGAGHQGLTELADTPAGQKFPAMLEKRILIAADGANGMHGRRGGPAARKRFLDAAVYQ